MAKEAQTSCTMRMNSGDYAVFSAICALKNTTVSEVLRNYAYEYIASNRAILTDATERLNNLTAETKK